MCRHGRASIAILTDLRGPVDEISVLVELIEAGHRRTKVGRYDTIRYYRYTLLGRIYCTLDT